MKLASSDFLIGKKLMPKDVEITKREVFGITDSLLHEFEELEVLRVGDLEIIFDMCIVTWKGTPIDLSVKLLRILHRLARRPGIVKTRSQLLDEVWSPCSDVYDRTVDQHIKRLRKAFRHVDPDFDALETLYGMGWRWRREAAPKWSAVRS